MARPVARHWYVAHMPRARRQSMPEYGQPTKTPHAFMALLKSDLQRLGFGVERAITRRELRTNDHVLHNTESAASNDGDKASHAGSLLSRPRSSSPKARQKFALYRWTGLLSPTQTEIDSFKCTGGPSDRRAHE